MYNGYYFVRYRVSTHIYFMPYMCNYIYIKFQNGFLSALPYLLLCLFSMPCSWLADWLLISGKLSRNSVRKFSTTVGLSGAAIGLALLAFANCDHTLPVIYLCISVALDGACYSGFSVRHIRLTYRDK